MNPLRKKQKNKHPRKIEYIVNFSSKRKVIFDANIWIEYALSKKPNSLLHATIKKAKEKDIIILPEYVYQEALNFSQKKQCKSLTELQIKAVLLEVAGEPIVSNIPYSVDELMDNFHLSHPDRKDRPIVFYSNLLGADILITYDKGFYKVEDINARVLKPVDYLYEEDYPEDFTRAGSRRCENE